MSQANFIGDGTKSGLEFLAHLGKDVVAYRANGSLFDLSIVPECGVYIEPVLASSTDGLNIIRHSAAHIMAQAVQRLFPDVKLGIGPFIKHGFYYDFFTSYTFSPVDFPSIEAECKKIVKEDQLFLRRSIEKMDALREFTHEPFKLELIELKAGINEDESVEINPDGLTVYDNVCRKTGNRIWGDLCRGPHVPSTGYLASKIKILRVSAAYWRGSERNPSMQRIYATAWDTKENLERYLEAVEEAEKRDHRRLGKQLDLFSFSHLLGPGLPLFHPNGAVVKMQMEEHSKKQHILAGYSFVSTPHITKAQLYELSGHIKWYKDGMYPPMRALEGKEDKDGNTKPDEYYLKPMNCPMHNLIYLSSQRSYRDLPLRFFELGSVYRFEKSGVVHGLTRSRGFTQDDAHIYCTQEQLKTELKNTLEFVLSLLRDYGLKDFYLELSTKDENKFIGEDETWKVATDVLRDVAHDSGLSLRLDEGGAAFYGPKISVQVEDAIGRSWQISTIQLDFNLPERFDLEYTDFDGVKKRPIMIHRALFGSIERFLGILIEHYGGRFPVWLAPVQVAAVPVANQWGDYLQSFVSKLQSNTVRVVLDMGDDRMSKKIRTHAQNGVPIILIAGEKDASARTVSFRFRDGTQINGIDQDLAVFGILRIIKERINISSAAEAEPYFLSPNLDTNL